MVFMSTGKDNAVRLIAFPCSLRQSDFNVRFLSEVGFWTFWGVPADGPCDDSLVTNTRHPVVNRRAQPVPALQPQFLRTGDWGIIWMVVGNLRTYPEVQNY